MSKNSSSMNRSLPLSGRAMHSPAAHGIAHRWNRVCVVQGCHPSRVAQGCTLRRVLRANFFRTHLQHQRCAGFSPRLLFQQQQHGSGGLDRAAKTEPRSQRHATQTFRGNIAEIQHHHAEAASLEKQVGHLQDLFHRGGEGEAGALRRAQVSPPEQNYLLLWAGLRKWKLLLATAHPKQPAQVDARALG